MGGCCHKPALQPGVVGGRRSFRLLASFILGLLGRGGGGVPQDPASLGPEGQGSPLPGASVGEEHHHKLCGREGAVWVRGRRSCGLSLGAGGGRGGGVV